MCASELRFTHVIFDLDGTLLDTLDDLADSCNHICAMHGWPVHTRDAYRYFIGNGAAKLVERATPQEAHQEPLRTQVLGEFMRYYEEHKADKTCPYAGVPAVVDALKRAGVQVAVLTNKPDPAAKGVIAQYYPGVFCAVQGALPGVPVKPEPDLLNGLLAQLGAERERTLFVGDSNVDIRTARNAGVKSCGVLWGFRTRQELEEEGADHIAADPPALLRIVLKNTEN